MPFNFKHQWQNVKNAILDKNEDLIEIHFNLFKKHLRKENFKEESQAFIAELKDHKPPLPLPALSPYPIDATDDDGSTLLTLAVHNKCDRVAELLIEEGAWTHLKTKSHYSAIDIALENHVYRDHNLKILSLLIAKNELFNIEILIQCLTASLEPEKLFDSLGKVDISKSFYLFTKYACGRDDPRLAFLLLKKTGLKFSEASLIEIIDRSFLNTTQWVEYALLIDRLTKTLIEHIIERLIKSLLSQNQITIVNIIATLKPSIDDRIARSIVMDLENYFHKETPLTAWLNLLTECQFDKSILNGVADAIGRQPLDYAISLNNAEIVLKLLEAGARSTNTYFGKPIIDTIQPNMTPATKLALEAFMPGKYELDEKDFAKLDTDFLARLLFNANRLYEIDKNPIRLKLIKKIHLQIRNTENTLELCLATPLTKIVSQYLFFPGIPDNKLETKPEVAVPRRALSL